PHLLRHRERDLIGVQHVREVDSCTLAEAVVSPGAGIDVKQLERVVPAIELVFKFDKAVVVDRSQEPQRHLLEEWVLHRLHEGACPPKLGRVLAKALYLHARHRTPSFEESAVGKLCIAVSRDELLDHHLLLANQRGRVFKASSELLAGIRAPGFSTGRVKEVLFDRWFYYKWRIPVNHMQFAHVMHSPGAWRRNVEALRELVRLPLVVRPFDHLPGRRGNPEVARKPLAIARESRDRLLPCRVDDPTVDAICLSKLE